METETDATSEQEARPERREEVLRVRSGAWVCGTEQRKILSTWMGFVFNK